MKELRLAAAHDAQKSIIVHERPVATPPWLPILWRRAGRVKGFGLTQLGGNEGRKRAISSSVRCRAGSADGIANVGRSPPFPCLWPPARSKGRGGVPVCRGVAPSSRLRRLRCWRGRGDAQRSVDAGPQECEGNGACQPAGAAGRRALMGFSFYEGGVGLPEERQGRGRPR